MSEDIRAVSTSVNEMAEDIATCLASFQPGLCLSELRTMARVHRSLQPILKEAEELVDLLGPEPGLSVGGRLGRRLLRLSDAFLDEAGDLHLLGPDTVAELRSDSEGEEQANVA